MSKEVQLHEKYGISEKDLKFIHKYIECNFVASKAYALMHPDVKPNTAWTQASMILRKPKVQAACKEEMRFHFEYLGATTEGVLNEIKSIANSDITDFIQDTESGEIELKKMEDYKQYAKVIKKITITPVTVNMGDDVYKEKSKIVLELHDKLKALELMGKSLGLFEEKDREPQEVRVIIEHKTIRSRSDIADE